jgi:hypothetical protein
MPGGILLTPQLRQFHLTLSATLIARLSYDTPIRPDRGFHPRPSRTASRGLKNGASSARPTMKGARGSH